MFTGWILEMVREIPIIGLGTVRLLEGLGKDYWIGECECCTRNIPMNPLMYEKINGGYYCKTCAPTLIPCSNCTHVMERGDEYNYIHGNVYCPDCYESLPVCEDCGNVIIEDDVNIDIIGRGDTVLCQSCFDSYRQCDSCRNYLHKDDSIRDSDTCICQDCYDNYYSTCNRCDTIIYQDNAYYDEYSSETLCRDCYRRAEQEIIDYDPDIEVQYVDMDEDESFTIGMELEFECAGNRGEIARYVYEEYRNLLWSKTDGSLSHDNGLETPTQPMTWEYWLRFGKDELKDYFKFLNNRGCRAWRTNAGLHVSLGRSGFSTGHLYKFLKFFYENPEYIFKISRRSEDKFNKWCDCRTLDRKGLAKKFREGKDCNGDKYEAVNLQHHYHIEVRIFAGTLNWESFLANIEFCRGLYEYTRDESIKDVSVRNFQNFMWENREAFPHFYHNFNPTYQHSLPFNDCSLTSNAHKGIA